MVKNSTARQRVVRSQWDGKGYYDPPPTYVNEDTGEVLEGYGPSAVDTTGYEDLPTMIARFLRGERRGRFEPVYEIPEGMSVDEAFEQMDPTRLSGFDLADGARILQMAGKRILELRRKKGEKAVVAGKKPLPPKAGAEPPPAESTQEGNTPTAGN